MSQIQIHDLLNCSIRFLCSSCHSCRWSDLFWSQHLWKAIAPWLFKLHPRRWLSSGLSDLSLLLCQVCFRGQLFYLLFVEFNFNIFYTHRSFFIILSEIYICACNYCTVWKNLKIFSRKKNRGIAGSFSYYLWFWWIDYLFRIWKLSTGEAARDTMVSMECAFLYT